MSTERPQYDLPSRGIESVQSGLLLFGFTILLSIFMGAVILVNGA
ncbi:hypothetical protein ACLI4Z_16530 (plasmid) [Natrialbaceae archaeon A-arb3/5]